MKEIKAEEVKEVEVTTEENTETEVATEEVKESKLKAFGTKAKEGLQKQIDRNFGWKVQNLWVQ